MSYITLSKFREKLQNARDNVDNEVSRIIDINQEDIYDYIRSQLDSGKDADGNIVGLYARNYSKGFSFDGIVGTSTFGFNKEAGTPYNFQWTDSLFNSFFHEYKNGILVIDNKDPKIDELKSKYGSRLLDFSDFAKDGINDMINQDLKEWLQKQF